MNKKYHDLIQELWQKYCIHSSTYLNSVNPMIGGAVLNQSKIDKKFDNEVLNEISKLKTVKSQDDLSEKISNLRSKIMLSSTIGIIGASDEESLQIILDKIQENYKEGK